MIDLGHLLVCPECLSDLVWSQRATTCQSCTTVFPLVDGVPVALPRAAEATELKRRQAEYFDSDVDPEYEITRPHGAPRLYRWLLEEKFQRSITSLKSTLDGGTVLAVCAGSGLDAEFLARTGARVIAADISLGAARRAAERARRYALAITSVVADVERLPFANESIDVVYVHDGLHHLERPEVGLAEMARVARRAVCVSEPARAGVTRLGVRLGVSSEHEDSGNRVARLTLAEIADTLAVRGFRPVVAERYAMYYRHEAGTAMRLFSTPALLPVAIHSVRLANRIVGRFGNKLAVQAVRSGRGVTS
jgi:ubiquinone/menaquinone biosynthesis C-methylase UbiE